jgi:protocatechuate 4,5-dioxygenase beta chain
LGTGGGSKVKRVTGNYHIPISNTATAVLALETV